MVKKDWYLVLHVSFFFCMIRWRKFRLKTMDDVYDPILISSQELPKRPPMQQSGFKRQPNWVSTEYQPPLKRFCFSQVPSLSEDLQKAKHWFFQHGGKFPSQVEQVRQIPLSELHPYILDPLIKLTCTRRSKLSIVHKPDRGLCEWFLLHFFFILSSTLFRFDCDFVDPNSSSPENKAVRVVFFRDYAKKNDFLIQESKTYLLYAFYCSFASPEFNPTGFEYQLTATHRSFVFPLEQLSPISGIFF